MGILITIIILIVVMAASIYAFLILPRITDAADMELQATDYAHRGLWNKQIPENSLAAFAFAKSKGYGIELDVQLSRDGKVMVFHDETLERMCGVEGKISDFTAEELKSLSLLGTEHTIPQLSEVLELIAGRVSILIEIKGGNGKDYDTELCLALAEMLDGYGGAFSVQSFNPMVLAWFRKFRPRFARGQLVTNGKNYKNELKGKHPKLTAFALSHMLTNVISRPDFISIEGTFMSSPELFILTRLFKAKGFVWTARNPRAYQRIREKEMFAIFEIIRP